MKTDIKSICSFLSEYVAYDPESGIFSWKKFPLRRKPRSSPEASHQGYKRIFYKGSRILSHRAAWFLHYGELPSGIIDHIDGNPSNNAIKNLRVASALENSQNRRRGTGLAGLLGVTVRKGATGKIFRASIRVNRKLIQLGSYETAEQAHQVYLSAKKDLHDGNVIATTDNQAIPVMKCASTGERHIYKNRTGYQVKFKRDGKNICFGTFESLAQAFKVREEAKRSINAIV